MKTTSNELPERKLVQLNYIHSLILAIFCMMILPVNTSAQWNTIFSQSLLAFEDLCFIDDNNGFAVGNALNDGMVLKTTDGQDFTLSNQVLGTNLYAIHFLTEDIGYIAGQGGYIGKTTDGGSNWTGLNNTHPFQIFDLYFQDMETGYAVGSNGGMIKTTDGGLQWDIMHHVTTFYPLYHITAMNENELFACGGNGLILYSADQGTQWVYSESSVQSDILCIDFTPGMIGLACTSVGEIIITEDQGQTWQKINSPFEGIGLYHIFCMDDQNFYVSGENGLIARSNDGGSTWSLMTTDTDETITTMLYTGHKIGYAVGAGGNVLKDNTNADVSDISACDNIKIYLIPGSYNIIIENKSLEAIERVFVYDIHGRTVFSYVNLSNQDIITINMSKSPTGIYVIKGELQDNKSFSRKVKL